MTILTLSTVVSTLCAGVYNTVTYMSAAMHSTHQHVHRVRYWHAQDNTLQASSLHSLARQPYFPYCAIAQGTAPLVHVDGWHATLYGTLLMLTKHHPAETEESDPRRPSCRVYKAQGDG